MAKKTKTIFNTLSEIDKAFDILSFINKTDHPPVLLTFNKDNSITDIALAEHFYKKHEYWIKKIMPQSRQDIHNDDYGIAEILTTIGDPLENIKYSFNKGDKRSQVRMEFPRGFERDFGWYKKLLVVLIEVFEPDYGGLYPIVIQKLEPPFVSGGWVSYFHKEMHIPANTFANCVKLPISENVNIYTIEDQHMIPKNETQYKKLEDFVKMFKELNIQKD